MKNGNSLIREEGWNSSKGFALIDEFEFTCSGYQPNNPLFDLIYSNGYSAQNQNSLDLETQPTWEDHPKFKSLPFQD